MPHLDASELSSDAKDIAFLRDVLGTAEGAIPPRGSFEVAKLKNSDAAPSAKARQLRRTRLVSEAA